MKRYCGMRLTPEAMAMLGMITAEQYIDITGDPRKLTGRDLWLKERARAGGLASTALLWQRRHR
jgi:hypothetical protein